MGGATHHGYWSARPEWRQTLQDCQVESEGSSQGVVQEITAGTSRLGWTEDVDSAEVWGCWCWWHQDEAGCHQARTQGESSKVFWTSQQIVSKGPTTRRQVEEKIPGQVEGRDSKIVCGENVCRHWWINYCCNGSGESYGRARGDSVWTSERGTRRGVLVNHHGETGQCSKQYLHQFF